MRLGIYGGSFDPVHYGHLLLAESCREQNQLDKVWFVPAAKPPHKMARELTPARERIEMLKLAIGGHEAFEIWTGEIDRGGVSYTIDTLEAARNEWPDAEIFLLMGEDMLRDLPSWRRPEEVCRIATPVVADRRGAKANFASRPLPAYLSERLEKIDMPAVDFSSSDIRERVARGRSIRFMVPRGVEAFIEAHGLYSGAE